MTAIERTAYRRLKATPTASELADLFTPLPEERRLADASTRGQEQFLAFLVLLKCFQCLGYFPDLEQVPVRIIQYLRTCLQLPPQTPCSAPKRSKLRYYAAIRAHLGITYAPKEARAVATAAMAQAARTMDHPADLINVALECLVKASLELPAFSTLDRIAGHVRTQINTQYFMQVASRLTAQEWAVLDRLLVAEGTTGRTVVSRLKDLPASATISHLDTWLDRFSWLQGLLNTERLLADIPLVKIRHFAAEARSLDAAELRDMGQPKRAALLLALVHQSRIATMDELIQMFIKRMAVIAQRGREALQQFHEQRRATQEQLLEALAEIAEASRETPDNELLGGRVRSLLNRHGGPEKVLEDYEAMAAYHGNNYLPLLWTYFKSHRAVIFRFLKAVQLYATHQDQAVVQAWQYFLSLEQRKGLLLPADLPLEFASEQWQRTIRREDPQGRSGYDRRHLEICICLQIAADFRSGDLAVRHSQEFADLRAQLLPWEDCQPCLADYCQETHLPPTGRAFVEQFRAELTTLAQQVDARILDDGEVNLSEDGEISLRRTVGRNTPSRVSGSSAPSVSSSGSSGPSMSSDPSSRAGWADTSGPLGAGEALAAALQPYLPRRSVLEILKNMHHWTGWTRHFGPLSGSDPKLEDPITRYVILAFGQGCNLGFAQTARHLRNDVSAHELSFVNRRHVTAARIDRAIVDLVNAYHQCTLPKLWGGGKTAAADGTKIEIYRENLFAEYHLRYGGYGGIAYYHISDMYVALFSHFITCGTWEGIYIIDGLLKNASTIRPDTIHADTQGQSTTVFAMAHLLRIQLMPRIRNWKGLVFYRPDPTVHYRHLDHLFGDAIDWGLIETHWQDLLQVVLSVRQGKVMPSTILRKLGNYSRKNRLYQVFRELGRAVRTVFLLRYISATTNKVETYNAFQQWIRFGKEGVLEENDPLEMEKLIKFTQLVANAIMLSNVLDMSAALRTLLATGSVVTTQAVAELSPYLRQHIARYGEWSVDIADAPPPLDAQAFASDLVDVLLNPGVA
jgi:TnpA family transposase